MPSRWRINGLGQQTRQLHGLRRRTTPLGYASASLVLPLEAPRPQRKTAATHDSGYYVIMIDSLMQPAPSILGMGGCTPGRGRYRGAGREKLEKLWCRALARGKGEPVIASLCIGMYSLSGRRRPVCPKKVLSSMVRGRSVAPPLDYQTEKMLVMPTKVVVTAS